MRWDVISLILLFSYSLFLYNLAKGKRSNPPLQVVRSWVDEINKVAKTKLSCTLAVYTTLVERAQYLTSKLAKLSGGRQRQKVLSTDWSSSKWNYFCTDRVSVDIVSYTLGLSRPTPCRGEAWYTLFVHVRKYSVMFSIKTFVHFLVRMQKIILTKHTIQQKGNKLNYQKGSLVATEILTSLRTRLVAASP